MKDTLARIMAQLRYHMFWIFDRMNGSKIKNHLNEISFILENFNHDKAIIIRQNRLNALLQHAVNTVPFYYSYKENTRIEHFPVVNKNIVIENKEKFISELFRNRKNKQIATSGSTGIPFKIVHNKNKVQRNSADIIYFSKLAGYRIGHKLLYLRHWSRLYKTSKIKNWMQNLKPLEVLNLNDTYISEIIEQLNKDSSKTCWLGFPSAFEDICKYLEKTDSPSLNTNITCMIGMAERLDTHVKRRMEYYFKAPMVSRYSNMENGVLAQQIPHKNNDFIINWASYYIEVLHIKNNEPAPEGVLGRIVVTDLFNFSIPLIRYDTGDVGILDRTTNPPVLKKIEGRKTDLIYDTKGNPVSPFIMANSNNFDGINQIQLIQENRKEYVLNLNTNKNFNQEAEILVLFKTFLGKDAHISVNYLNTIPLLDSGKRKATINNYIK